MILYRYDFEISLIVVILFIIRINLFKYSIVYLICLEQDYKIKINFKKTSIATK